MTESIVISLITGGLAFIGNLVANVVSNNKTKALIEYRLDILEKKQDKHNSVIERTYKLEKLAEVFDTRLETLEKRA